jgi:hypothetical protein
MSFLVGTCALLFAVGCGSSEDASRPLSVGVVKGILHELPGMRYRLLKAKERDGSGAVKGLALGPGVTEAEFEVSFRAEDAAEIRLGPELHSGSSFPYPGGYWGITWREVRFHRHRPQTGVTGVERKICKWTTGDLCPI